MLFFLKQYFYQEQLSKLSTLHENTINSVSDGAYYNEHSPHISLIRYNSLPKYADWVIDFDDSYYEELGIKISYDKEKIFSLEKLRPHDVIFIKTDLLRISVPLLKQIKVPFHLLTGVSDLSPSKNLIRQIAYSTKLVTWSGHNLPINLSDKKFLQIPIGFPELGLGRSNQPPSGYLNITPKKKIIDIVLTPCSPSNQSRQLYGGINISNFLRCDRYLDYGKYLDILGLSTFSICPPGNGADTHRVYESILMGCIPVVEKTILEPLHRALGCVILGTTNSIPTALPQISRDVITEEYWGHKFARHLSLFRN